MTQNSQIETELTKLQKRLKHSEEIALNLSTHNTIDNIYQYSINGNIVFYRMDPHIGFEVILRVSPKRDIVLSNDDKYLYVSDDSNQDLFPVEKLSETYFRAFRNSKWLVFIKESQNKLIFKEPENGIYYNGFGFKIVDDSKKGPVVKENQVNSYSADIKSFDDYKDMETFTGRVDWHSDWQTEK